MPSTFGAATRPYTRNSGDSYSSTGAHSVTEQTVPLPADLDPGVLIGRGGANLKLMRRQSTATFNVPRGVQCVVVRGSQEAVQAGVRLVRAWLEAWNNSRGMHACRQPAMHQLAPRVLPTGLAPRSHKP
jgi:hypothetical protein